MLLHDGSSMSNITLCLSLIRHSAEEYIRKHSVILSTKLSTLNEVILMKLSTSQKTKKEEKPKIQR